PKAIVFILAVLPQFLDPARPLVPQYLVMALTMVTVDLIVTAGYTGLASRVIRLLDSPRQQRLFNRSLAAMLVPAAGLLATVRRARGCFGDPGGAEVAPGAALVKRSG